MHNPPKSQAELQTQRAKLATSYTQLLEEFSSKELRTVGNYTVGHLIGKGSFGKAYLAHHKLINGSKVVLKSADKQDPNLAREIHHHRQFVHPHIARLYEVIVTETLVWLVLEYCPGNELYHYLTQHGPLAPTMVQKIFTQLVGAVAYVHQKSCVHRDLKLENILLDKNENVKLCDFGFTREYEGKSNYLQTWCGTVCYSAPEMLKGEKYAGEKVDVWSLGVILYALLCGELPFDEEDDDATKKKILKEEPKYPDTLPAQAKDMILMMLSKRTLLRPSLADILMNPWLADWAPQQQAILKIQTPAPFSTQLETDTLQRMKSAGVNIDAVIENVLSQRCDALAGWWALLLEKEERKEKRRRKRRDKDAEAKVSRRISTASSRIQATTIKEIDEGKLNNDAQKNSSVGDRGRSPSRTTLATPTTPSLRPPMEMQSDSTRQPPQVVSRSAESQLAATAAATATTGAGRGGAGISANASASSKRRSQLGPGVPPKRNSMLQVVATDGTMLNPNNEPPIRKRRQPLFFSQLSHIKHWFKDSTKKTKALNSNTAAGAAMSNSNRPNDMRRTSSEVQAHRSSANEYGSDLPARGIHGPHRLSSHASQGSGRHLSHSPSPMTPKSSYRRSAASNLRGRKSTSSSVSSVRSMHMQQQQQHHATHSKASSVSSASLGSPSNQSIKGIQAARRRSSPNTFVKVLPAPAPSSSGNQGGGRPIRIPPSLNLPESQGTPFSGIGPPSPGLMFAKRKRSVFKGPMLGSALGTRRRSDGTGLGVLMASDEAEELERNNPNGEIIREEDEDEDGEDDVEEVDSFTPIAEGEREYLIDETGRPVLMNDGFESSSHAIGEPPPLTKWELDQ